MPYLAQPNTAKTTSSGSGARHSWGVSAMQGWRTTMEDAHITLPELVEGLSLFAVFDGHGGKEVAAFCRDQFSQEFRKQFAALLASGDGESCTVASPIWGRALAGTFLVMDEMLRLPENQLKLYALKHGLEERCALAKSAGATDLLYNAIRSDLSAAVGKGALGKEAASRVMMKVALLRQIPRPRELLVSGLTAASADRVGCTAVSGLTAASADRVGCTAVCVLLSEAFVVCANAGDSRAVLCRAGAPIALSHDHKPTCEEERRRIETAGGYVQQIHVGSRVHYRVNGCLTLSRAIGDLQFKRRSDLGPDEQVITSTPDIVCFELTPEDEFIVIACDGVWDVMSNAEVCQFVGSKLKIGQAVPQIVEELLDACCTKNLQASMGIGGDNMTCIIVQLRSSPAGNRAVVKRMATATDCGTSASCSVRALQTAVIADAPGRANCEVCAQPPAVPVTRATQYSRTKNKRRTKSAVQRAKQAVERLVSFCARPAQGGKNKGITRKGKPNGGGFSKRFHRQRVLVEKAVSSAPELQQVMKRNLKQLRVPKEGGRFNSKSKWLYVQPLQRIKASLDARA